MWFWWFVLVCDMLIPILMVIVGNMMRKHTPEKINGMIGYRTARSMKNIDTWKFAHDHCGRLCLFCTTGTFENIVSQLADKSSTERSEVTVMQEKYERQMKKGVLDMLVLRLLLEEKKYGYQLIAELREKGGDIFGLKEGTLYPILYRLEDEGLIESRWSEAENRQPPRKYYLMTDRGRMALEEIHQVWRRIVDSVDGLMEQSSGMAIEERGNI